jgi:hypothetical protein
LAEGGHRAAQSNVGPTHGVGTPAAGVSSYVILAAEGYETADEVVFTEPADMILLGVRTLEGFGVAVDNIAHRFVAQTTIVAPSARA